MSTIKVSNLQNASAASPAITLAADGSATASLSSINGGPISGTRNRIINGDMRIDQRNAGVSVTPTATGYTLDRWSLEISQASKLSVQRNAGAITPPTGFTNYVGITTVAAYAVGAGESFNLRTFVEGYNFADMAWGTSSAATTILSFWVRSSLTGTFGGSLRNDLNNRSYPFTYAISAANTWEQKTITFAGETTGTWANTTERGVAVIFGLGVGTTGSGTAGAWAATNYQSATGATSVVGTNGATFYITGVQLEPGTVATPFERRSYGAELALCQRYFEIFTRVSYNYSSGGTGAVDLRLSFAVTKRAVPTCVKVGTWTISTITAQPVIGSIALEYTTSVTAGSGGNCGYDSGVVATGAVTASAEL